MRYLISHVSNFIRNLIRLEMEEEELMSEKWKTVARYDCMRKVERKSHEFNDKAIIILTWELSQSIERNRYSHTISFASLKIRLISSLKCVSSATVIETDNYTTMKLEITNEFSLWEIVLRKWKWFSHFPFLHSSCSQWIWWKISVKSFRLIGKACKSIKANDKKNIKSLFVTFITLK